MAGSDFCRGNELLRNGKLEEAIVAYQSAIARDPSFHWYHQKLGEAFEQLERWQEAIAAYQKAIALNSNCSWSYYSLAMAFARQGEWEEGRDNYRKAVEINPDLQQLKSSFHSSIDATQINKNQPLATGRVLKNQENLYLFNGTGSPDSKPRRNIFWIASYPKSGNTWIRYILAHLLFGASEREEVRKKVGKTIPDLHYQKNVFEAPEINFAGGHKVSFAKTHTCGFPDLKAVNHVGFIYIYRHPLDVLISAINYYYVIGNKNFFHDRRLHSADDLKKSGGLDYYVEKFMEDLRIDSFYKMSDTWIENVRTWTAIADRHPNSLVLRYEDLIDDTFEHLKQLSILFDKKDENIKAAIGFSQKHTNDGGKFFWKKKSRNYEDYLDKKMIERFNDKYAGMLDEFGYG